MVYGVLADAMGRPLAVQAYAGNTGDPTTVPDQVEKVRGRFGLQRVVLVGDRGLLTETQINHLKRHPGLGWISALRHRQIRRLVESEAVQLSLFDERHLAEVRSPDYPARGSSSATTRCWPTTGGGSGRRCGRPPKRRWPGSPARWRDGPARPCQPPRSPRKSAASRTASRWPNTSGQRSQTDPSTMSGAPKPSPREAQLDGFYMLRTSEGADRLPAAAVVRRYKDLTRVERGLPFSGRRSTCTPSHPSSGGDAGPGSSVPVPAGLLRHWHLRQALAPLLFDDEELEAERARRDPVLAAQPSDSAKRKKAKRLTEEGLPLQSLETLMAHLGTRARHRCRLPWNGTRLASSD